MLQSAINSVFQSLRQARDLEQPFGRCKEHGALSEVSSVRNDVSRCSQGWCRECRFRQARELQSRASDIEMLRWILLGSCESPTTVE